MRAHFIWDGIWKATTLYVHIICRRIDANRCVRICVKWRIFQWKMYLKFDFNLRSSLSFFLMSFAFIHGLQTKVKLFVKSYRLFCQNWCAHIVAMCAHIARNMRGTCADSIYCGARIFALVRACLHPCAHGCAHHARRVRAGCAHIFWSFRKSFKCHFPHKI